MQQESLLVERQPPACPLSYDAMRQMDRVKIYLPAKYRQSKCHNTNFLFPLFSSEIFSLRYAHFMHTTTNHGNLFENNSRDVGAWNTQINPGVIQRKRSWGVRVEYTDQPRRYSKETFLGRWGGIDGWYTSMIM